MIFLVIDGVSLGGVTGTFSDSLVWLGLSPTVNVARFGMEPATLSAVTYFANSSAVTPSLRRALIVNVTVLPANFAMSLDERLAVTFPFAVFASSGLVTVTF
ncbi:Uncharacterised protein [Streptococcus suis]|uniref:Uncharacterized protein n=1 Tax=Streptococcus suis TaxID=1307 RepID=A0A0Z8MGH6_STRSU|nr:Uncharacterised protein [Streptococcus suis]CYV46153.1 Uncharacterised protein [Streptococcus suis]CYW08630.1 Uncharacterised protein [Streptococcus suis]CYW16759.1 Uncharacterised protein [Streptococcus suis]CYW29625.1 Uncharacterised protein [Streptococcus suis]